MVMFKMICGCEADAWVRDWGCSCCGGEYEIEDAEITKPCATHGGE